MVDREKDALSGEQDSFKQHAKNVFWFMFFMLLVAAITIFVLRMFK